MSKGTQCMIWKKKEQNITDKTIGFLNKENNKKQTNR